MAFPLYVLSYDFLDTPLYQNTSRIFRICTYTSFLLNVLQDGSSNDG